MTTLINPAAFVHHSEDFVKTDTALLASHMNCCASKRSPFFGLQAALEMMHSVVFSRIVTVAVFVAVVMAVIDIV